LALVLLALAEAEGFEVLLVMIAFAVLEEGGEEVAVTETPPIGAVLCPFISDCTSASNVPVIPDKANTWENARRGMLVSLGSIADRLWKRMKY